MPPEEATQTLRQPRTWGLKRALIGTLIPVLGCVFALELFLAARSLYDQTNAAYDRSLAGAIKAIDANISTESGGLAVELPYRMLEFFELTASGAVYFRVATEDGLVEIGHADLPAPPGALISRRPAFYDATYFGEPMRIGAYARPLAKPLYGHFDANAPQRIVIQVAEAVSSREAFRHEMLIQLIGRDLLLVLLGGGALALGILLAMRPLDRVKRDLMKRSSDDLTPVDSGAVPVEVRPLVHALNSHIRRFASLAEAQRHFLDDASHQLRTPLAVLRAQVDYALRERDPTEVRKALTAMAEGIERATHVTNQFLSLARAQDAGAADRALLNGPDDLAAIAERVARNLLPIARERKLDFGFEAPAAPIFAHADSLMLGEALSNLAHNAIRHSPPGGTVTVYAGRDAGAVWIGVDDNGPGIPQSACAEMGQRFAGRSPSTGGLGLAIAKATAMAHHGKLVLGVPASGVGLSARIVMAGLPGSGSPVLKAN